MIDLDDLIAEARELGLNYGGGYQDYPGGPTLDYLGLDLVERLADALEAATRVPVRGEPNDELIEYALDYIENGTMRPERREALRALASRATVPDAATELRAERDAALAAVERVAKIHGPSDEFPAGCDYCERLTLCSTRAALDGAPEPDGVWEYGYELIEPDDRNVFEREGDFISAVFAYRAAKKRIHEERHPDVPSLQYAIIRRRKAGPWLPVEGESKP